MSENNNNEGNIFINGKAQILEMFQYLTAEEKARLLRQIRPRNPQLADEIIESSLTFKSIIELSDQAIEKVISYVKAPVLGLALKSLHIPDQRKILSLCPRHYAEEAFKVMNARLSNENRDVNRACDRIKSVISALTKKKII